MLTVTTLADLTTDQLGDGATADDLAMFRAACAWYLEMQVEDPPTEAAAIDAIWHDGDWWPQAARWSPLAIGDAVVIRNRVPGWDGEQGTIAAFPTPPYLPEAATRRILATVLLANGGAEDVWTWDLVPGAA